MWCHQQHLSRPHHNLLLLLLLLLLSNLGLLQPLHRFVQGTELWDNIKKFAMASFAMKATERDPDFVDNFCKVVIE
jgi:hypothetical protein